MDNYGIGSAIRGAVSVYFQCARATGRTKLLVESVADGDMVWFTNKNEAERVRRLCLERHVKITCMVNDPQRPSTWMGNRAPKGKLFFDHTWIEAYYLRVIELAERDLDHIQELTSGRKNEEEVYASKRA